MNASWIDNEYFIALTPGYVRDGSVKESRIFTFQIPRVNESHEGTYACRPEGYQDDQVRTCELVLTQSNCFSLIICCPPLAAIIISYEMYLTMRLYLLLVFYNTFLINLIIIIIFSLWIFSDGLRALETLDTRKSKGRRCVNHFTILDFYLFIIL